jgi:hypothetical protein
MAKAPAHFDAETIALLKVTLDEAWDCLPRKLQATMLKTTLAERILKSAAHPAHIPSATPRGWPKQQERE